MEEWRTDRELTLTKTEKSIYKFEFDKQKPKFRRWL